MSSRTASRGVAVAAAAAAVLAGWWRFRLPPCDDAFIVLTAVRNALAGAGAHLVPAHGDAVLSTLLWPLLVGLGAGIGLDPVVALRAAGVLGELFLALAVVGLGRDLARTEPDGESGPAGRSEVWGWTVGALTATALVTHPVLVLVDRGGMETAWVMAVLAAATLALSRRRIGWVAACVALLPWLRFDAALAAAVFGFAALRVAGRRDRLRLVAAAVAAAGAFLAERLLFGVWLPDSVTAKVAAGAASSSGAAAVATGFAAATIGRAAYWLIRPSVHLVLWLPAWAGVVRIAREPALRRRLAPLVVWTVAYVGAFAGSGNAYATNFPWYFAPPLLTLTALAAAGLGLLPAAWRRLRPRAERSPAAAEEPGAGPRRGLAAAAPALAALAVWLAASPGLEAGLARVRGSFTAYRERSYAAVATWLAAYGPARSIASNEVGTLAWFSPADTEIVDLVGLSRAPADRGRGWEELVAERPPDAIVTRIDFRYRRRLEATAPGSRVWVRAGALDVGLTPELAQRLAPRRGELEAIYRAVDLERAPSPARRPG
jgi:hypothetical protein